MPSVQQTNDRSEGLSVKSVRLQIDEVRCRRLMSSDQVGGHGPVSRRMRVFLAASGSNQAVIRVRERVVIESSARLDFTFSLHLAFEHQVTRSTVKAHLVPLAQVAAPASSELVALLTRRMGMTPVILPPVYESAEKPRGADGPSQALASEAATTPERE